MAPGPPGTAGVKVSWEILRLKALRGFLVSSSAIMTVKYKQKAGGMGNHILMARETDYLC